MICVRAELPSVVIGVAVMFNVPGVERLRHHWPPPSLYDIDKSFLPSSSMS